MKKDKTKIYILGASGFLGSRFSSYIKNRGHIVLEDRLDLTKADLMEKAFLNARPDVVINFAGVRAYPNIDWCEDNKEETVRVNVVGAINAMMSALKAGAYPIQISSGCIYSGDLENQFTEEDAPNFYGSFYSRMRIVLQNSLSELPVLCARIRLPMSSEPHPRNTITKIVGYKNIISVPNSVTLVEDLWPAIERLIELRPTGILNLTNEGHIDHRTLLTAYKKFVDTDHRYNLISVKQLEDEVVKAKRSNCILSMAKARSWGISMPELTDERLEEIMIKYKNNLR